LPEDSFDVSDDGRRARVRVSNIPVLDQFQFLGPNLVPATVSFEVVWTATGAFQALGKGKSVPATDPAAFIGRFARARAVGSFSGAELGFTFQSNPGVSSDRGFAEMGTERNGAFL
jgi:hypothetical protein